jgi:hypothetical protein
MTKLAAVRGRRLQSHPCVMRPEISNETRRERDVPSVIVHYGSAGRVCWNSAEKGGQRVSWRRKQRQRRTTYASAPKSHHLRELKQKLKRSQQSKTHLFWRSSSMYGANRECVRNWTVCAEWEPQNTIQHTVLRCPKVPLRTRSIVRFAMRVPSYSAASRDDEYNDKTNNSRWPKIMSVSGLRVCNWKFKSCPTINKLKYLFIQQRLSMYFHYPGRLHGSNHMALGKNTGEHSIFVFLWPSNALIAAHALIAVNDGV